MRSKKGLINVFSTIAFMMMIYCLIVFVYIQSELTVDMIKLTDTIKMLGNFTILALFIVGLFHLYLLVHALKTLAGKMKHSIYIMLIVLSGITLLNDLTLLSDIGKEYLLWDISAEWIILYCSAALHMLVMIYGLISLKKAPADNIKLFKAFKKSNDILFLSIHQISFISGLLGICGIILAMTGFIVPSRFGVHFMILLAGLALFPLILIIIYWIVKMRKKPVKEWIDEKQMSDTALGALFSFLPAIALYLLICILDLFKVLIMPVSFWILLIFFTQLAVFSAVIMAKNKK